MATKPMLNIIKLKKMKEAGDPISMITAYDYPSARLAEEAGIDIILVGDSLAHVVLGYDSTIPITIDDMVYHSRSVARGATHTFIVTDMPFMTYHGNIDETLRGVRRIMQEGYAHAVKMEGGAEIAPAIEAIVKAGVPVLGHIGLIPQSVNQIGGYRIQGKTAEEAKRLMEDAKALEKAGAFAIVLELVTEEVAAAITAAISIPVIGIGAGRKVDGQVLVYHDVLKYTASFREKRFVKTYADLGELAKQGITEFIKEVKTKEFPSEDHVFAANEEVLDQLYGEKTGAK